MHASPLIKINKKSPFLKLPFAQASYHSQVYRLRKLAEVAVKNYPIQVKKIDFVNHGENTVFKIVTKNNKMFMLRIHRHNYHTEAAIKEELNWLTRLSQSKFIVPKPVKTKQGKYLLRIFHPYVWEARYCCLFEHIEGQFFNDRTIKRGLTEAGELIGKIQKANLGKTKHRIYWTAEGLVGKKAKFGQLDRIPALTPKQQDRISKARKLVFHKIRTYEKMFPRRLSYIHADLHFGNLIDSKSGSAAIDFDDSGYGFYVYDLVIPYLWAEGGAKTEAQKIQMKEILIEAYKKHMPWDKHDEEIFKFLVTARNLTMIAWMYHRFDNPRIKNYFKKYLKKTLRRLKKEYGI